jgi:hypothetical protein
VGFLTFSYLASRKLFTFLTIGTLIAALLIVTCLPREKFFSTVLRGHSLQEIGGGRLRDILISWDVFLENPILGTGMGSITPTLFLMMAGRFLILNPKLI